MRLWIYYFTAAFFVTASMSGQAQTYATVRVLTVFTNEAMVFYPVVPAGVAQAEIGKTNQALITSGASVRVENAGVLQINLPLESVGPSLYRAKYDIRILKARDTYNADVVIIIHDVYGGGGLALESPATKPENAMAMISVASIPGNEFGYQHEIAHLMGANHQSDGGVSANSSAPSIGKAWYWRNKFAGIMYFTPQA